MTIHQLKELCWVLDPSPYADDDYGIPHYGTQDKAAEALAELAQERVGDPEETARLEGVKPKREDAPCWVAECDGPRCGEGYETYEDSESGGCHFENAETLTEWLLQDDWTTKAPDKVFCSADSPEDAPPRSVSPAEQEAAGQLVIPGVLK